jgi:hypothetical protein
MDFQEFTYEGSTDNETRTLRAEKLNGNYEFWAIADDGEKFKFISDAGNNLEERPPEEEMDFVNLTLEYDSSMSDAVREEKLAREIKVLEDQIANVIDYDPDRPYEEDKLTHGDDAFWMQTYTEDRDELIDFIRTTDFYVDE